jgi:hypothetical protein
MRVFDHLADFRTCDLNWGLTDVSSVIQLPNRSAIFRAPILPRFMPLLVENTMDNHRIGEAPCVSKHQDQGQAWRFCGHHLSVPSQFRVSKFEHKSILVETTRERRPGSSGRSAG